MEAEEKALVYNAVVHMAWGDRRVAFAERVIAEAIAEELAVPVPDTVPTTCSKSLETLGFDARRMVYALSAWMAYADGVERPAERSMLRSMRERLNLGPDTAFVLESVALIVRGLARTSTPREQFRVLWDAVETTRPMINASASAGTAP